ncbi:MAG: exo-beta-1,3-glucanase (GH17 family) [Chitinophagales bacterium]|jgi:exo-beta-1,3-glucanase (GH17 family)
MFKRIGLFSKMGSRNFFLISLFIGLFACSTGGKKEIEMKTKSTSEILGNPNYQAISYGGYRTDSRNIQPSIEELKEDLKLLSAVNISVIRTYNVHLEHAVNLLMAIEELKLEVEGFEMYVLLGAWIDCKNAWTDNPIHDEESERNALELNRAVDLANEYPDIVIAIAVGNESMVKWATSYFVLPEVILKWVNHLQDLKKQGALPKNIWITSSDNFASWGGGDEEYKTKELSQLFNAVDFVSLHTYPMHDTHYNPKFWGVLTDENDLSEKEKIDASMQRALEYAQSQYYSVKEYMLSLGVQKPIHIGETGWASYGNELYGDKGSSACDEYKAGKYYQLIREWTNKEQISCFYFEAFDESWKDANNPGGSENHFGLISLNGEVKYALWDQVDIGAFDKLKRNGNPMVKTYGGELDSLLKEVKMPPVKESLIPEYHAQ